MITLSGRIFRPPGPVAGTFMADRTNRVRALLGPQGGGKTVACIHDLIANAALQPACKDGRVRFRVAAIRDTYDRLEKTTIKTWTEWVPRELGEWTGGGGRSATHTLNFKVQRNGVEVPVEFEIIFAAIGDQAAEDFMRGFEVTAFWLNEMDLLTEDVLTYGIGRVGRFPKKDDMPAGVEYRRFIVGDLNAPDIDSWFYRRFEEDRPEGHAIYRQPSGRSDKAENIRNLVDGYYAEQVRLNANKRKWIKRFVDAQYGPSEHGEPVYPEYSDDLHLSREPLKAIKGLPIKLGFDQGLRNPACVIMQAAPSGQHRILGETVPGRMSANRFAEFVKREIADVAPDCPVECGWADPAGFGGADVEGGETSWAQTLQLALGIPILPAPSNELTPRHDAVRDELTYMIDGATPALLVSSRCKMLRKGFASHYMFDMRPAENAQSPKPVKNLWSNPHDALQYVMLGDKGLFGVITGDRPGRAPRHAAGGNSVIRSDYVGG